jgi:hypothetical protein
MKTYPLYLNESQLRLVLDLLNASVDDLGQQIAATLNAIQAESEEPTPAEMFARGVALTRKVEKKRKPTPVRRVEAIEQLGATHPEAAKALAAWKNKANAVLGWDRWLRANYPAAADSLWPSDARKQLVADIDRGVRRASAFVSRIKPARNHA